MTTKKSIKEKIIKEFNIISSDANWYASRYYNFLKIKKEVKADTIINGDIIIMSWANGFYKIKIQDHIDTAIMIPLLHNNSQTN